MENVTKCPAKSKRNPPLCNFRVIGQAWIRVTVYVSSRIIVRRILYYLYLPYVSPEGMIKFARRATGHFVTLIEIAMHLITCISGHIWYRMHKLASLLGHSILKTADSIHIALVEIKGKTKNYRGFARQPCRMAGTIDYFSHGNKCSF